MSPSNNKSGPDEAAFTEKWLLARRKEVRGYLRRNGFSGHAIEQAVTVLSRASMPYIQGMKVCEIKNPRAWAFKVAINAAIRAAKREVRLKSVEPAILAARVADPGHGEELFDIREALKQLTEKQRAAVELCFLDEMSQRDAAKVMGVSVSTLHENLIAGKHHLQEILPALMPPSLREHYIPNAPASHTAEGEMLPLQASRCFSTGSDGGDCGKGVA
jgi:RNA polymerase sigma factor (sigma-70 family)